MVMWAIFCKKGSLFACDETKRFILNGECILMNVMFFAAFKYYFTIPPIRH